MNVIVYNDISDLNQTNIGVKREDYNMSGTTKIINKNLFVYFDGNHQHLREDIRKGIARVLIQKMLSGSSFQEVVQSAIFADLPEWFVDGLIDYIGEDWTTQHENRLRDGVLSGKLKDLTKLSNEEMTFVAHSLWHYIENKHGKNSIANLLYLTRTNRSLDRGFNYVVGKTLNETLEEWYYYYLDIFKKEKETAEAFFKR